MLGKKWSLFSCMIALVFLLALGLLSGCGGDDTSGVDGDEPIDGDDARKPCLTDADCEIGQICGTDAYCRDTGNVTPGDEDGIDEDPTKTLRFTPGNTIDLGEVELTAQRSTPITIYNDGNSTLHLYDTNWLEPQAVEDNPFSLDGYLEAAVQPGSSFQFEIVLNPLELGEITAVLELNNDSDNMDTFQITLTATIVEPSGQANIGSYPETVAFGDVPAGSRKRIQLYIGNDSEVQSQLLITGLALQTGTPYELVPELEPSEDDPVELNKGESLTIDVWMRATQAGNYTDKVLCFYHTNTNPDTQTFEVPITGKAVVGALLARPSEMLFETVPLGGEKPLTLDLTNALAESVTLTEIRVTDGQSSLCDDFFKFAEGDTNPVALASGETHTMTLTFKPTAVKAYDCELTVATNYEGQRFYYPVTGEGTERNQKPVARVSQSDNGPDITADLEVPVGSAVELFGDISYDPDGPNEALTFSWILDKPLNSNAHINPDTVSPVVNAYMDVAGDYSITLTVTDEMNERSNPKLVRVTAVSGLTTIRIEMRFSGLTGASDIDLRWSLPSGAFCDETRANASGTCAVPTGEGSVLVQACAAASQGCTSESISHAMAPDGRYTISAIFDEDCPGDIPIIGDCTLGVGTQDVDYDIYIYVDSQLTYQMTGEHFSDEGDMKSWTIVQENGQWSPPVLAN